MSCQGGILAHMCRLIVRQTVAYKWRVGYMTRDSCFFDNKCKEGSHLFFSFIIKSHIMMSIRSHGRIRMVHI
ncbi:hypothetical protein OIU79_018912 [Salix purpurea]|uniref:Uncharacterized protein n=1 Tax=Salix purpurea TaxID=77065 RepID=A0A9Q0SJ89_SALPP|nr:hypothetical protein OIU79_018912 [Salix purpurea]